jgi:predicted transcriptional regulator
MCKVRNRRAIGGKRRTVGGYGNWARVLATGSRAFHGSEIPATSVPELDLEQNDLSSSPVELATELTIAWLSNPNTRAQAEDIPAFLRSMHEAVVSLGEAPVEQPEAEAAQRHEPAVTVRKSLSSPDHIISLIDGKPYKTLRRHLSRHGMTPEQYRERYNLKADYPMVAPAYAETRRDLAKKIGLGSKGRKAKAAEAPTEKAAPSRRKKLGITTDA